MRVLREPLLQFLLAGALLLAAQRLLAPLPDERRIELTPAQVETLAANFRGAHNRAPDAAELQQLAQRWVDEEVLYREARALGLDQADLIVRRELQQKMRYLLEDTAPIAEPTEAELQQWLQQHAERYGHPPRYDFEQVFLTRSADAARVQSIGESLRRDPESYAALGDPLPGGAVWRAQSQTDLRRNFGTVFAQQLPALPDGAWSGPLVSSLGSHWVRVNARTPFRAATLDEVRREVLVDARLARREAANRAALDTLRARYDIRLPQSDS